MNLHLCEPLYALAFGTRYTVAAGREDLLFHYDTPPSVKCSLFTVYLLTGDPVLAVPATGTGCRLRRSRYRLTLRCHLQALELERVSKVSPL